MLQKPIIFFIACIFMLSGLFAQDTISKKDRRKAGASFLLEDRPWTIVLPLWVPGFRGNFSYGDIDLEGGDGDNPGDPEDPDDDEDGNILERIFSKDWYLKFFFLSRFSYEKKRFLASFDSFGGAVGYSTKFNYNNTEIVQMNFRTLNLRLFAAYRIVNARTKSGKFQYKLYGYLGVRAHFNKIYSDLNDAVNNLDVNPVWAEPLIGIKNVFALKRWQMTLQADYGGLFVPAKYSSMLQANVSYRTGRLTSLKFGWNTLILNHSGTFLGKDLYVKVRMSGPSLGLAFHF